MNGSIKYWKKQAKMNLSGHWGSAIAGVLAVGAVTFIGNILSIQLFPGSTLWPMVAGQVFVFVFSLIAMVFRAGYSYMLLNMARDREETFFICFTTDRIGCWWQDLFFHF